MIPILIPIGLWVGYSLLKNSKAVAAIAPSIGVPGAIVPDIFPEMIQSAPAPGLPTRDFYPPATPPETIRSAALSTLVGDLVTPVAGALGTKANPVKINKPAGGSNTYIPGISMADPWGRGFIFVPAGAKIYYELNPGLLGVFDGKFRVCFVFFAGAGVICELTQDKDTGNYSAEVRGGYTSYNKVFTILSNKKFLFAIDNTGVTAGANDAMWVQVPFVP